MLSAIIALEEDPAILDENATLRAVAKTLAALVGAVVDDVVADAFVVARPGFDFRAIEERTGCGVLLDADWGAGLRAALARARRPHILLLMPGYTPGPGFAEEVAPLLAEGPDAPALVLRAPPATLLDRVVAGRRTIGLIAPRRSLERLPAQSPGALRAIGRALSAKPLRTEALRL